MQVIPLSQSFCRLILAIFHPFVTTIARFENRDASIASESVQSFMHLLTSPPTIRTLKATGRPCDMVQEITSGAELRRMVCRPMSNILSCSSTHTHDHPSLRIDTMYAGWKRKSGGHRLYC